jgi:CheY-like chemotaxis protein
MEQDPADKGKSPPFGERPVVGATEGEAVAAHRVLVIDDEPTIRVALRRFFTRLGWEVSEAADGRAALALLIGADNSESRGARFDMVLSDIRMPGLNGIQLYDRLKTTRPDIVRRLVFSTGDVAGSEAADLVRELGCPLVQKPFMLSELQEIAERLTKA